MLLENPFHGNCPRFYLRFACCKLFCKNLFIFCCQVTVYVFQKCKVSFTRANFNAVIAHFTIGFCDCSQNGLHKPVLKMYFLTFVTFWLEPYHFGWKMVVTYWPVWRIKNLLPYYIFFSVLLLWSYFEFRKFDLC